MHGKQAGIGLSGLLIWAAILAMVAVLGMKVGPEYLEFAKIKQTLKAIKNDPSAKSSVVEVRKAFDKRADVDSITAITSKDLEVSKESGEVVVSFAYERRVPLFANISLVLDFQGSSQE